MTTVLDYGCKYELLSNSFLLINIKRNEQRGKIPQLSHATICNQHIDAAKSSNHDEDSCGKTLRENNHCFRRVGCLLVIFACFIVKNNDQWNVEALF